MAFRAEKATSKSGKYPLLVYRLAEDNSKCYKFKWKRTNKSSFAYNCVECVDIANYDENVGAINSLQVKKDYSEFLSNPESIGHFCEPLTYLDVNIEQTYR